MAVAFGPYKLLRRIAAGGMGEVYLSVLERGGFRKPVAIKRILPGCCQRPDFAERFAAEAALSAMLNHANIVQIFDHGCIEGSSYLAMELVEGPDLAALLAAAGPLEPEMAAEITLQLCRALGHAHQRRTPDGRTCGIVHGDVSPSNILLTAEGQVKLADFGIARLLGSSAACQGISGKLCYMSPEQARGDPPTPLSDLFSLGLVLLEMLGGKKPRPELPAEELLSLALRADHLPLEQLRPGLAPAWQELLGRLLAPQPTERLSSAEETARFVSERLSPCGPERLGAFVSRIAPAAIQNTSATPERTQAAAVPVDARRPSRGRMALWLGAGVAAAAIAGIATNLVRPKDNAPRPPRESVAPAPPTGLVVGPPAVTADPAPIKVEPDMVVKDDPKPNVAVLKPHPARLRPGSVEKTPLPPPTPPAALELDIEGPWGVSLDHTAVASRSLRIEERTAHLLELKHAEKDARVSLRLAPAMGSGWRLAVSAEPWMNIRLDGRPLGQTPRIQVPLSAGEHRLSLTRRKHDLGLSLQLVLPP